MELLSQVSKQGGNTDVYYVPLFPVSHCIHSLFQKAPGGKEMPENHITVRQEWNL